MEKFIHLRWLDLSYSDLSKGDLKTICELYNLQTLCLAHCHTQEIPWEIRNLVHLRHLDLGFNDSLSALPESVCDLLELRTLSVEHCNNLSTLPQGIDSLKNLKYIFTMSSVEKLPQGFAQLNGLRGLSDFWGGSGWSNLGLLKNLNLLTGYLRLRINLTDNLKELVEDAWEAELWKKIHIRELEIIFSNTKVGSSANLIDALKPHQNLRKLIISSYDGSKLPGWIASPLNQLSYLKLSHFRRLSSLPPLGRLQCLEEVFIKGMPELQFVGREFLGITRTGDMDDIESSSSSSSLTATPCSTVGFPKLKKLIFNDCPKWKKWEDITAEEEESALVSIMPCLTELNVKNCPRLTALPHRLLRKASSLEILNIYGSKKLIQQCNDINPSIRLSNSWFD